MKNLFLALAFTGFVGAASINTVSAVTYTKVTVGGGEECKKGKKCKKNDACCKTKTATSNDKKSCSSEATKKCCSHSKTTAGKPAATEVKSDSKTTEAVK